MAYLYRHIRKDTNQVFYIGIGVRENHRRARTIVQRNQYWKNIVANTDWYAEVIFDEIDIKEAQRKEIEFIALYGRHDLGKGTLANMTDGGEGTRNWVVPKEMRKEMSRRNIGKTLSEEHKAKISAAHKGKTFSQSTLDKMRDAKMGIKQTDEHKKKRALKLMGNKSTRGQGYKVIDGVRVYYIKQVL
jgi:hypothetical protein